MTPILARQRPDRSFERLYEKYAADVYRYALVVLRNQADAEDVTQTTFMNAYRAFERGERPRAPQNWLIAIAHTVCRQRFRQSQRRPNEVELNEELAESIVDDEAVSAEDIKRALGHLAFNQRAALVMRELDGRLSRKEKSGLRAHLRECGECAHFARSQRAQRGAIKSLALIPLPSSLTSFFGHGGAATATATAGGGAAPGGGPAGKGAAVGAGGLV